ncbi:MAG: PhnD/SsuA/transferrin family substrate-binding protein [Deltaproteobacteria bacterium]|nr:PhnD/SsuA/transferrin family substrate-binding protein [Deltaproteobacteria bacterium]
MRRFLGILLVWLPACALAQQPAVLERAPLNVGFTVSSFRGVNPADAKGAFMVFAQTVGRQRGYELDTSISLLDDPAALETAINKKQFHLVVADAWESLGMNITAEMEPAFVHEVQGVAVRELLLLTRQGSELSTLADLRGKEIAVLNGESNSVASAWIESLLLEQGLGTADTFFGRVETTAKPSATILPVFFGKKAACVADRLSFETMMEMNPQVGRQLVTVATSPPFAESITFLTRHGYSAEQLRRDMFIALEELHLEPAGRQILTLFKVEKLTPFTEEHLLNLRALRTRLAQLRNEPKAKASAP